MGGKWWWLLILWSKSHVSTILWLKRYWIWIMTIINCCSWINMNAETNMNGLMEQWYQFYTIWVKHIVTITHIFGARLIFWRAQTYQVRPTSQRVSWWINSILSEKNYVEELFYGLQQNLFSRKFFSTKMFPTKCFSTKCRKSAIRTKQVSLGYSLFFWGVLYCKSCLISQWDSWKLI